MKIPFVKNVESKKEMYDIIINILQCFLPTSKKLTNKELEVFTYLLSKGDFHLQCKGNRRIVNSKELGLNETAFAMHRTRIAKKGWIEDSYPDKLVNKIAVKLEDNPDEVEINIKLKWKSSI